MSSLSDPNVHRQTALALSSPHSQIEDMLFPAPKSIALLAQLMLIATVQDFKLKAPLAGFSLLKYPDSFRACLVQVANGGYTAFSEAHENMLAISRYIVHIPTYVQEAIEILQTGRKERIEKQLDTVLRRIQEMSKKCAECAQRVETQFQSVLDMSSELLEASVGAKGDAEMQKIASESRRAAMKEQQRIQEELMEQAEKQYQTMKESVQRAQLEMEKVLDEHPSNVKLVVGLTVDYLVNSMNAATSAKQQKIDPAVVYVDHFTTWSSRILELFTDQQADVAKILSDTDGARIVLYFLQVLEHNISGSEIKGAKELVANAIQIIRNLNENAKKNAKATDQYEKAVQLDFRAAEFSSQLRDMYGLPPATPVTVQGSELPSGGALRNDYQYKLAQTKKMMADAQDKFDKARKTKERLALDQLDLLQKFEAINIKDIDFQKIRTVISEGIKALTEVREQWVVLVMFFQQVSALIKVSVDHTLKSYGIALKNQEKLAVRGIAIRAVTANTLYATALKISAISHQVRLIANTYVDVSSAHFVKRIASLQELAALNPARDVAKIESLRKEINEGCMEAQKDIQRRAQQTQQQIASIFSTQKQLV